MRRKLYILISLLVLSLAGYALLIAADYKSTSIEETPLASLVTTPAPKIIRSPLALESKTTKEQFPSVIKAPQATRLIGDGEDEDDDSLIKSDGPTSITVGRNDQSRGSGVVGGGNNTASDPITETLMEIQRIEGGPSNGNRIYGVRSRRNSDDSSSSTPVPTATPTPTPTPGLLTGITTGYTILSLMHPGAQQMAEAQVEIMLESRAKSLYLGVLADGTFTFSYPFLNEIIRKLNTEGRTLTLVLYFANGSAMRQYDRTPIDAGFNLIEPEAFRYLIVEEQSIRSTYRSIVSRAIPTFQLNRSLSPNNRNIAVVMLEDNLDLYSYRAMRELTQDVLGDVAVMARNPCEGPCYGGGDLEPDGDIFESHSISGLNALRPGDGFSLDGIGYRFNNEPPSTALSIEEVKLAKDRAIERRAGYFGLWRAARQGLGNTLIHPDDRSYEVPTLEQRSIELNLFRHGLRQETTPQG